MLKKYITYAKLNVFPKIHDADLDKISHVYAELRRESSVSHHFFLALLDDKVKYLKIDILENLVAIEFATVFCSTVKESLLQ